MTVQKAKRAIFNWNKHMMILDDNDTSILDEKPSSIASKLLNKESDLFDKILDLLLELSDSEYIELRDWNDKQIQDRSTNTMIWHFAGEFLDRDV